MFDITGKVAIVTGGASGIGLSTVEQLLKNGIKGVTIADINEENGKQRVQEFIEKYGTNKVLFVKVNVALRNEFEEAFKATVENFQNLDIVINAAGIVKDLIWEEEIAVNLGGTTTGTYFAFEHYLPKYKTGSEGVIVNLSSITALDIFPYAPVYSATKSGIITLSRCYGSPTHYNRKQSRVMALCPGYTHTPIHHVHHERVLHESFHDMKIDNTAGISYQSAEHVATTLIEMIKQGANGSVWVVEESKTPYEIKFLGRKESKK